MKAKIWNKTWWVLNTNPERLKAEYLCKLIKSGFNVLDTMEYFFKPCGYTGLFLLAESHLAIHTFPEENKTYVELSSCVEDKFNNFIIIMQK